jgi:hypothetical protein
MAIWGKGERTGSYFMGGPRVQGPSDVNMVCQGSAKAPLSMPIVVTINLSCRWPNGASLDLAAHRA